VTRSFLFFLAAAALFSASVPAAAQSGSIELRVALALKAPEVSLSSGGGAFRITSAKSGMLLNSGPMNEITVRPHGQGIRINDLVFPVTSVRVASPNGIVSMGGRKYRGYFVVRATDGGLLDLEDYLRGVVPSEMPVDWPLEALKAQAVAARTYALYRRSESSEEDYDLLSDVNDQVYLGAERENEKTDRAVLQTAGMILTYKNNIVRAYYHSTSGGRTENGEEVFKGANLPYLKSVWCRFDRESPYYVWRYSLRYSELQAVLSRHGIRTGKITGVSLRSRTRTSRIKELNIHTPSGRIIVSATEFRKAVGTRKIRSTRFTLRRHGPRITFKGIGYGHGVGMCQWGAKGMAEKNHDFREILLFYYRGAKLTPDILFKPE